MNTLDRLEELSRKATPGPWRFWPGYGISPQEGVTLCFDGGSFVDELDDDAEPDANTAVVIAMRNALPNLLHALRLAVAQEATKTATEYFAINKEFRAALAELTAESEP